jgi:hypothetical protein
MRGLVVAVVCSVLVHAFGLAWYVARDVPPLVYPAPPPPEAPPSPTVATLDPAPLEVVLLDEPSNGGGHAGVAASTEAAPVKRGRITRPGSTAAGTSETARPDATGGTTGTGERSPYMTMRKPGDEPMHGPSADFVADFLNRTKPIPPPPDIPGERVGDQIADLRAQLKRADRYSPEQLASMRAELVALNAEREAEELEPAGGGSFKTEKDTFRAHVNPDGSVKLTDKPKNMDAQDRMMLRHGIDPYARNKLAYLDRTRDQRVAIGKRYREEQLGKSVIYMQKNIAWLWSTTSDPAKRKQGLFELWDECMETGSPEEIAGGESARAFVMAKIRATVKFTPEEVRALNAQRTSKQVFAP